MHMYVRMCECVHLCVCVCVCTCVCVSVWSYVLYAWIQQCKQDKMLMCLKLQACQIKVLTYSTKHTCIYMYHYLQFLDHILLNNRL